MEDEGGPRVVRPVGRTGAWDAAGGHGGVRVLEKGSDLAGS